MSWDLSRAFLHSEDGRNSISIAHEVCLLPFVFGGLGRDKPFLSLLYSLVI